MDREYHPTPRLLRSACAACAVTITVALGSFIDLLASERDATGAYVAEPAVVIIPRG